MRAGIQATLPEQLLKVPTLLPGPTLFSSHPLFTGIGPVLIVLGIACPVTARAAAIDEASGTTPSEASQEEFFESRIRPMLVQHCYECHSSASGQEGGLALDTPQGWQTGGTSGPAIVPGDPSRSLLIQAVSGDDPHLKMPPEETGDKLTASQIADLQQWILWGAFDPRENGPAAAIKATWSELFAQRSQWWSLQPIQRPAPPDILVSPWDRSALDRFIFAAIKQAGLTPTPEADPYTLIRRVSLVLTGLPPDTAAIQRFIENYQISPDEAYTQLVDQLLDSPTFGERFARHWMDVVRFTETHGNEWNYDVPYAWRYRDYLIRSFNQDVPFDQLAKEHIAGDLMERPRVNAQNGQNESVVGTAFYRFGEVNHDSCVLFGVIGYDIADNQLDTLTKAFQATTVACARCHDHKLDAVSTADYHALLGILRSTRSVQHNLDPIDKYQRTLKELSQQKLAIRNQLSSIWAQDMSNDVQASLDAALAKSLVQPLDLSDPLYPWWMLKQKSGEAGSGNEAWLAGLKAFEQKQLENADFNEQNYQLLTDFRQGLVPTHSDASTGTVPASTWYAHGPDLRHQRASRDPGDGSLDADLMISPSGNPWIERILPSGVYSGMTSTKLNAALRSPTLSRTHSKLSFEVIGNGFSLARIVFNNCQLNYTNQHSIHHPDWSWVTVDFQSGTEAMAPYAELLTYWDNPKFPDPLGTLSKDTENQRLPWSDHAKDPRTWWGIRRIVAHDTPELPRDDLKYLDRLWKGRQPSDLVELVDVYRDIFREAAIAFVEHRATDEDVRWLNWMLTHGILSNDDTRSDELATAVRKYREQESSEIQTPTMVAGMADETDGITQPILIRGDYRRPGEAVPRRYLQVLESRLASTAGSTSIDRSASDLGLHTPSGSGRQLVADSITHPDNPLTSRVFVNRVWQWIFGQGLVRTPDDFGHLGDLPSHPELLDHLASQFVDQGWSIKKLVRSIVLSRTFRGSSTASSPMIDRDPDNRLLAYYPARRGEAELIRDSLLAVSGRLNQTMFGPSVHPYRAVADTEKRLYVGPLDGEGRRSIYLKVQLMEAPHFISVFNLPGGKVTQGRRDQTNVPAQSLALMNDPLMTELAQIWGRSVIQCDHSSVAERLDSMMFTAVGRPWRDHEREHWNDYVLQMASQKEIPSSKILSDENLWREVAHTLFNLKEFIYIP